MKPLFAAMFGSFLLLTISSWAGMPDEDPMVRDLHSRFQSARLPTDEEMIAYEWECITHATLRGNFERGQVRLKFSRAGSTLRLWDDRVPYLSDGHEWVQTHRVNYSGGHSVTVFVSFRIDERGRLVGEGAGQLSEKLRTRLELRASTAATTSNRAYAVRLMDCAPW